MVQHLVPHLFPVQDSTLSADALAGELLRKYGLSTNTTFFRKGICDTYRIQSGSDVFFLKVFKSTRRTEGHVAEEVRLLRHLLDQGVSVVRPIPALDGTYLLRIHAPEGLRFGVLYEAAQGSVDDNGDESKIAALGEMVARMHVCADGLPGGYDRPPPDSSYISDGPRSSLHCCIRRQSLGT